MPDVLLCWGQIRPISWRRCPFLSIFRRSYGTTWRPKGVAWCAPNQPWPFPSSWTPIHPHELTPCASFSSYSAIGVALLPKRRRACGPVWQAEFEYILAKFERRSLPTLVVRQTQTLLGTQGYIQGGILHLATTGKEPFGRTQCTGCRRFKEPDYDFGLLSG